jgi:hypothetical protein
MSVPTTLLECIEDTTMERVSNTRQGSIVAVMLGLVLACVCQYAKAEFAPNESVVSLQRDLVDLEFSASRSQIVWTDSAGSLWIGNVDPVTGMFLPANGKGILVDADAMRTADLYTIYNGPEWISIAGGDQIVYTKYLPKRRHLLKNARLAIALENTDGSWSPKFLGPNVPRNAPYASDDPSDQAARITYIDPSRNHYWREIKDATTESLIPLPPSLKSVRFVRGSRAVIFSTSVGGIAQVFRYDLDTRVLEQLTFDEGDKDLQTVPWMWPSPEHENDHVFLTVVNDTELRIYRYNDGASGGPIGWAPIHTITVPEGTKIASPEPFLHNGRSYISMALSIAPNDFPSEIWLANIDAARPVFRRISDNTVLRVRSDPEVFITSDGPYIYYNRYNQDIDPDNNYCADCSEGVFRAHTGLLPPE